MALPEPALVESDRERWREEHDLRRREHDLHKREIEIKEHEANRNRWSSPLVLAILSAAVAGLGNAVAIVLNGIEQRERIKSDQARAIEETKAEAAQQNDATRTVRRAASHQFLSDCSISLALVALVAFRASGHDYFGFGFPSSQSSLCAMSFAAFQVYGRCDP